MPIPPGYKRSKESQKKIRAALSKKSLNKPRGEDSEIVYEIQKYFEYKIEISEKTWQRFWDGKQNISKQKSMAICEFLELDYQDIVESNHNYVPSDPVSNASFYGRKDELIQLEEWVTDPNCHLVLLHGLPETGKHVLVQQLEKNKKVIRSFEQVEWVKFSYGASVDNTLRNLIQQLDPQDLSNDLDIEDLEKIFWAQLQQQHCLIVLEQEKDGQTRKYDDYKKLLTELVKLSNAKARSSCILLITCYQKYDGLTSLDKVTVKYLPLGGVDEKTGLEILENNNSQLVEDEEAAKRLILRFSGHPRALQLIGSHISNYHNGNVSEFLDIDKQYVPDTIECIIRELLNDLDKPAQVILDILKDSPPMLQARLRDVYSKRISDPSGFTVALDILLRRFLLVKSKGYGDYGLTYLFGLDEVTKQVVRSYLNESNSS
jgi:DNA-binding Xre family transcriptional regulator